MKAPKILASVLGALILVSTFAGAALAGDRYEGRRDGWHNGYRRERQWWGRGNHRQNWNRGGHGPRNGYYARRAWFGDRNRHHR